MCVIDETIRKVLSLNAAQESSSRGTNSSAVWILWNANHESWLISNLGLHAFIYARSRLTD